MNAVLALRTSRHRLATSLRAIAGGSYRARRDRMKQNQFSLVVLMRLPRKAQLILLLEISDSISARPSASCEVSVDKSFMRVCVVKFDRYEKVLAASSVRRAGFARFWVMR